jgi:hypothetical protein
MLIVYATPTRRALRHIIPANLMSVVTPCAPNTLVFQSVTQRVS